MQAADFPKLEGWTPISEVSDYEPDNLWEYINGAAELFLAYGFHYLQSCDLEGEGISVTVDIYHMGERLNAYGMYKTERPDEVKRFAFGGEAVVSPPYQALLLKDAYYVKVNIFEGELSEAIGISLLEKIAVALPGEDGFPDELALLPATGKIPGTEGFAREGYLGQADLQRVVYAKYEDTDERTFERFLLITNDSSPQDSWQTISSKWEKSTYKGFTVLIKEIPYRGFVGIVKTEGGICGVTEAADEKEVRARLDTVLE